MIEIEVSAAGARLLQSEVLTSGRVGLRCRLICDSSWDGLRKTAVLVGSSSVDLLVTDEDFCIPAECLSRAGDTLKIGLYGLETDGSCVIPTVWVNCGEIRAGAEPTQQLPQEQTQSLLAQIMDLAAQAADTAASLREDAEHGVFNGRDGRDGIDGRDGVDGRDGIDGRDGSAGPVGPAGAAGAAGADGTTFTPSVSAAGVLSWTNDGGAQNPASVDLVSAVISALPTWQGGTY